jgi:hypothetical protein
LANAASSLFRTPRRERLLRHLVRDKHVAEAKLRDVEVRRRVGDGEVLVHERRGVDRRAGREHGIELRDEGLADGIDRVVAVERAWLREARGDLCGRAGS